MEAGNMKLRIDHVPNQIPDQLRQGINDRYISECCRMITEKIQAINAGIPYFADQYQTDEGRRTLIATMTGCFERYASEFRTIDDAMDRINEVIRALGGSEWSIIQEREGKEVVLSCGDSPSVWILGRCPDDTADIVRLNNSLRYYWQEFCRLCGTKEKSISKGDMSFQFPVLNRGDHGNNQRGRDSSAQQMIAFCEILPQCFTRIFQNCTENL